jgi:hypothetical protein
MRRCGELLPREKRPGYLRSSSPRQAAAARKIVGPERADSTKISKVDSWSSSCQKVCRVRSRDDSEIPRIVDENQEIAENLAENLQYRWKRIDFPADHRSSARQGPATQDASSVGRRWSGIGQGGGARRLAGAGGPESRTRARPPESAKARNVERPPRRSRGASSRGIPGFAEIGELRFEGFLASPKSGSIDLGGTEARRNRGASFHGKKCLPEIGEPRFTEKSASPKSGRPKKR